MEHATKPGRSTRIAVLTFATASLLGAWTARAQQPGPHTLWSVYVSAGADAAKAGNWPETEALFAAAVDQAQQHQPAEPYLTIAKYSLAAATWEEGEDRVAESRKISDSLQMVLNPESVHADLLESADALTAMGYLFYNQAQRESDAGRKSQENSFARSYFQWALVIDERLLPPDSPELSDPAELAGVMDFEAGDYLAAIDCLTQMKRIQQLTAQREKTLSSGSMAYSLAAPLQTGAGSHPQMSEADVDIIIAMSYERVAEQVPKDKLAEAARDLALAEPYLERHVDSTDYGKRVRERLLEMYQYHEQLLQQLMDPAAAAAVDKKAKLLGTKDDKPS